jgi:hypothetical protein
VHPLRWFLDLISFLRWHRETRKNPGFFGLMEDDPVQPDNLGSVRKRRVFLSYARSSLVIAKRIEKAFERKGMVGAVWRYEPTGDPPEVDTRTSDNFASQMDKFCRDHPAAAERLEATLRRCVAYVFLVSPSSMRSAVCDLESFVVARRFTQHRERAPVYVVLEKQELKPTHLSGFRTIVYQAKLEKNLAAMIADELEILGLDYPSRFI